MSIADELRQLLNYALDRSAMGQPPDTHFYERLLNLLVRLAEEVEQNTGTEQK